MEFLESPRFPGCPSYGYTSEPMYSTVVTQAQSGRERRNRLWARPLFRFTFEVGPRAQEELQAVNEYFHAVGGRESGFRFRDEADYLSCRVGETATAFDQLAAPTDDPLVYQLMKYYTVGSRTQERIISKPVSNEILLGVGGVAVTTGFAIDYATGLITFDSEPGSAGVTWGGQFDVPVRFDSDSLPIILENRRVQSASFTLTVPRLLTRPEESRVGK